MDVNLIITDDFLANPDHVREQVLKIPFDRTGGFPGVRSDGADEEYQRYVQQKITAIMGVKIDSWKMDSFSFQLCTEDVETWVHKDKDAQWAGVLYLTPNAPQEAGTGIFTETKPGEFELQDAIANKYNRLVLYRGDLLHRSLLSGFGNSIETGRLTQVFFFDIDGDPGGGWE
jgi:hypothetical protein